jgi:hypothetical protein
MFCGGSIPFAGYFCYGYFCGYSLNRIEEKNDIKYLFAQFDSGQGTKKRSSARVIS